MWYIPHIFKTRHYIFDPFEAVVDFIGTERQNDVNAQQAAIARQAQEREAERNRAFVAQQVAGAQAYNTREAQIAREAASWEASQQRGWASGEAGTQRNWQKEMSDTAHQRESADLQKAGLNRILSVSKGGPGASTPSGGVPGGAAAGSSNQATAGHGSTGPAGMAMAHKAESSLGHAVSTAMQAKRNEAEVDLLKEHRMLMSSQWNKTQEEARLVSQQQKTEEQRTEQAKHQASILGSNAKGRALEGGIDETRYGEIMRYIDRAMRAILGGSSAYRNLTD